jgi:hypothetical protein
MNGGTAITGRGVEDRVTEYGDTVLAQGEAAAQPRPGIVPIPAAQGAPAAAALALEIAKVPLFDPLKRLARDSIANKVASRLQSELNALGTGNPPVLFERQYGIRFEVVYFARRSTAQERKEAGRWTFPLYLLDSNGKDRTIGKDIRALALDHGTVSRQQQRFVAQLEAEWADPTVGGVAVGPHGTDRKVGFAKGDVVPKTASDPVTAYINMLKHELGHLLGAAHGTRGVMQRTFAANAPGLDFTALDKTMIGALLKAYRFASQP